MHFSTRDHREKREESCPVHSTLLLPSFVPPATGLYLTARHTPWHPAQPTLPRYSPAFYSFSISSILSSFSISSATYSPSLHSLHPFPSLSIALLSVVFFLRSFTSVASLVGLSAFWLSLFLFDACDIVFRLFADSSPLTYSSVFSTFGDTSRLFSRPLFSCLAAECSRFLA